MSWNDLLIMEQEVPKEEPKREEVKRVRKEVSKPKTEPKPKEEGSLQEKINELERQIKELESARDESQHIISEQRDEINFLRQRIQESTEFTITTIDKRNLQFLVNCVCKTYKNEFRKNRAPAVRLALTNIIEKFGLDAPEEMN